MLRKIILSLSSLVLLAVAAQAQPVQHCETDQVNNSLRSRYPDIAEKDRQLEEQIQNMLNGMDLSHFAQKGAGIYDDSIYDIPVVVHIVHFYGNEYVTDNSVYDLIAGVNQVYSRTFFNSADIITPYRFNIKVSYNVDASGNPAPVTPVLYAGKADIRFHLATKDPEGRPTHGITRSVSNLYNAGSDQAKYDQWDPTAYLNIYLIQSFDENHEEAAAYAYAPGTAAVIPYGDGVIGLADYFSGSLGPATLSHEIGHELNLAHPWGNTNSPNVECGDDGVDDTPPTKGHDLTCGSGVGGALWDTTCASGFRDTIGAGLIASEFLPVSDTLNYLGIDFVAKSAITLKSVDLYPTAALGTPFQITLRHYGFTYATYDSVVTNNNGPQVCNLDFAVAADSGYSLVLTMNPRALRDSDYTYFLKDTTGIRLKNTDFNNFYNYFYNWKVGVGANTVTVGRAAPREHSTNTTGDGLAFSTYSRLTVRSVVIYPTAPIGTTFTIAINKNTPTGLLVTSYSDTVKNAYRKQVVPVNFKLPAAGNYWMTFSTNPGMIADTNTVPNNWKIDAVIRVTQGTPMVDAVQYLNYFHNMDIMYGYAKPYTNQYGADSIVDYPDTVNTQNIMDYSYCDQMFTYGQTRRMRAALESPTASRNNLWNPANLVGTGVWADEAGTPAPFPDLKPIADFSMKNNKVFTCADGTHTLSFVDRSWNDTISSREWTFSNGAITPTSTSASVNNNKFTTPGWITVTLTASANSGDSTITKSNAAYAADPVATNPIGYFQEFTDLNNWPIFNYFPDNSHMWKTADVGFYDSHSLVFSNNDSRSYPADNLSSPRGEFADIFSPAFDLSDGSFTTNCNINFMSAGASRTSDPAQQNDVLEIAYSINCGDSWITFDSLKYADLSNNGVFSDPFTPVWDGAWKAQYIDLPSAVRGKNQVFFRFRYKVGISLKMSLDAGGNPYAGSQYYHGTGNNVYLDRIYITNYPLGIINDLAHENGIMLAPNPTSGSATVTIPGGSGDAQVVVTDVAGKVIYRTSQALNGQSVQVVIPASYISVKGMYLVSVTTNGKSQTAKLVVN